MPCSLNQTCIILVCASCHDYARAFTMLFVSFRCCFLVPVMLRLWGFVRLLPFVFFMDSFFFLAGFQARWALPSISLLSLLASCSFYHYVILPTTCHIMPPILPCQASNPPFLANLCLATLLLCSAPLIALLVAGGDEVCSMLEHGLLGYHYYLLFTLMHLYTW